MSKSVNINESALNSQEGLGLDVVEIARIARIIERTPNFINHTFCAEEIDYCNGKFNPSIHFATHFAAKEAALKALGIGVFSGVNLRDICVMHNSNGKPELRFSDKAEELFQKKELRSMPVSLSFTQTDAVACVVCIYKGSSQFSLINRKHEDTTAKDITDKFKELKESLE